MVTIEAIDSGEGGVVVAGTFSGASGGSGQLFPTPANLHAAGPSALHTFWSHFLVTLSGQFSCRKFFVGMDKKIPFLRCVSISRNGSGYSVIHSVGLSENGNSELPS